MIYYHLGGSRQVSTLSMRLYKYTEQDLRDAVKKSSSVRQVLMILEVKPAGGNYQTFHKAVKHFGIDISHFTGQAWNKGRKYGHRRPISDYLSNRFTIQSYKLKRRLFAEGVLSKECSVCKMSEWLGKPSPLELDHINGNHLDNSLSNLRILCANCHAQTDNYRGRNKRKA